MGSYIQYVRREQKVGDIERDDALAWDAPVGLGTDRHLTEEFRPTDSDRIYLFSTLKGLALPSLDALVVVNRMSPLYPKRVEALGEAKKLVFPAGRGSRWFPMLDASALLERMNASTGEVLGKKSDKNGRNLTITQRLQGIRTMRCLDSASSTLVEEWAIAAAKSPVFISYRAADGSDLATETATHLAKLGIPVWFDEWSVSIRLDDLELHHAEQQLLENLRLQ